MEGFINVPESFSYKDSIFILTVAPNIAAALKIMINYGKRTYFWHLVLLEENVLFKESSPNIMVTMNPNWSTEILWYETGCG